ncbi:MAG: site-2 protease family protein [Leptospiraceae bacterium]|nr:site-2 protease family protein [Leptospiraceae bacterium]MCP5493543.1 site-2 protease family protein [Leptospiraceae bacterium]
MTQNIGFHIFLMVATFLSMTYKEALLGALIGFDFESLARVSLQEYWYSASLITILFCHEMGHYIPTRLYGFRATLPYFIPFPLEPIGTMGAVIKIQDPISDKKKLFDIGSGGPIASLILSVICWIIGIYLSQLTPLEKTTGNGIYLIFGDSIFTYWTGQWILGPYDPNSFDILIHPLAKAGWVGLFITAINLLPFGQLDGGHIIYAVFGEKYRKWIYYLFLGFLFLTLIHFTWLLWGFIIHFFIKIEHPYVPDSIDMGKGRKILGLILLFSLIFIFVPKPLYTSMEAGNTSLLQDIINFARSFF